MSVDDRHRAGPKRGRRVWDLLSFGGDSVERMQAPVGPLLIENLALRGGEAVLDVGCGRGAHFQTVHDAIGPGGRLLGVDFSPRMVGQARRRVTANDWRNVEIIHADACRDPLGHEEFDAALAVFSLSAMPDVHAAVQNIHAALRPGGRLFVLDLRLVPERRRLLIRLLRSLYRLLAGSSGEDVLAGLDAVFDTVEAVTKGGVRTPGRSRAWPPVTLVVARKRA